MNISARAKGCLLSAGYKDSEELANMTNEDLLAIKNMNEKCVSEVRSFIQKVNKKIVLFDNYQIKIVFDKVEFDSFFKEINIVLTIKNYSKKAYDLWTKNIVVNGIEYSDEVILTEVEEFSTISPVIDIYKVKGVRYNSIKTISFYIDVNVGKDFLHSTYCGSSKKISIECDTKNESYKVIKVKDHLIWRDGQLLDACGKGDYTHPRRYKLDGGVEELELPTAVYNALVNSGVDTIDELCEMTFEELHKLRNIGQGAVGEIEVKLRERGLSLKRPPYHQLIEMIFNNISKSDGSVPIESINLSTKTNNLMRRIGIDTVDALCEMTARDLELILYIGEKTICELIERLNSCGYDLKQEGEEKSIFELLFLKRREKEYTVKIESLNNFRYMSYRLVHIFPTYTVDKIFDLTFNEFMAMCAYIPWEYKVNLINELKKCEKDNVQDDSIDHDDFAPCGKEMSIDDLELSVRTYNLLKRAGVDNVTDLWQLSYEGLHNIRNMGKKGIEEILGKLQELGMSLRD